MSTIPSLAQLLADGLDDSGKVRHGFPVVLTVSPASFHFDRDGNLIPAANMDEQRDHLAARLAADLIAQTHFPVAFPTETVYGLGANAFHSEAVKNVFAAKGRPSDNPLIVHTSDIAMTASLTANSSVPAIYNPIIDQHWPGPLTLLLPKSASIPHTVTAGHESVAVRMPSHPVARAIIFLSKKPIAAPSANTSTRPSPTRAEHVAQDLAGRILLLIDGGPCEGGIESTVLDGLRIPPAILRPGGVTVEMVRAVDGFQNTVVWKKNADDSNDPDVSAPVTPGMKYKHYAPKVPVVLFEKSSSSSQSTLASRKRDAMEARIQTYLPSSSASASLPSSPRVVGILRTETQSDFEFASIFPSLKVVQQSLGSSYAQVGSNLFSALRDFEAIEGCFVVFVEGVEEVDEGLAVMNRVRKAAADIVYV
ncbi:DHBP synthase RibB-like alpha/beta domain-containing protein [Chytriomyces cf. hyalinus JEL632]|nr:DHBP synthase RibB-like alpha/beta domain-containing protein [Chytriomyces cf. hyalinus JEL632]